MRRRFIEINGVDGRSSIEAVDLEALEVGFWNSVEAAERIVACHQRKAELSDCRLTGVEKSIGVIGNQITIPASGIRLGTTPALAVGIEIIQRIRSFGRGGNSGAKSNGEPVIQKSVRGAFRRHVVDEL